MLRINSTSRANSTQLRQKLGETSSDTVRQWLTAKGAQHATAAYRCKFVAKKRLYKEQELVVSQLLSTELPRGALRLKWFKFEGAAGVKLLIQNTASRSNLNLAANPVNCE